MRTRLDRRRWRRPALTLLLGALLLVGGSSISFASAQSTGAAGPAPASPLAPPTGCPGSPIPKNYTGSLVVEGSSLTPPSVANRTVALSYYFLLNYTPKMGTSTYTCKAGSATSASDSTGGFSLRAAVPTSSCDSVSCSTFSGPFGPANFSIIGGAPSGYFVSSTVSGTVVSMAYVEALSTVALTPSTRVTLSTTAPTVVQATARAGSGANSPATVGYDWRLSGTGWLLAAGGGSANLTIEADDGASPGLLALWVNGSFNGTPVQAPEVQLDLAAVETVTTGGSANPTVVDVGLPVTFTVTGSGAFGYPYWADFSPGLGLPTTRANCTSVAIAGGEVDLTCATSVSYVGAGSAQASANLSNGYSGDSFSFLPIAVAAGLRVSVNPAAALAYPNVPLTVSVSADTSSGTRPFGSGCLWTGDGRTFCDPGPGNLYPFEFAYGETGTYDGRATVEDSAGANDSVPFVAQIVPRPSLGGIVASTNAPGVGHSASFSDVVSGGALPMEYWWNETSPAGTLFAGTETVDGTMAFDFTPYIAGPVQIVLTVIDRLGTVLAAKTNLTVGAGNASALVPRGTWENWTVSAGAPFPISWAVVDAGDNLVASYRGNVSLRIPIPGGTTAPPVWVNESGTPVPARTNGSFELAIGAPLAGRVNFTVTIGGAGSFELQFGSALPMEDAPNGLRSLQVTPDASSARLVDPHVVLAGARSNATLWRLSDRFGDALAGAEVDVRTIFDGGVSDSESAAPLVGNATFLWVNFSAPSDSNGTIRVYSTYLGHSTQVKVIEVPALVSTLFVTALAVAALLAAPAIAVLVVRRRRARRTSEGPPEAGPPPVAGEEELRRLAEGRDHVLGRAQVDQGSTLDELAAGFPGRPPTPEELTEWVASLLADGSLRTALGPDGRSRFYRTEAVVPVPPPRVELDDRALDEALKNLPDDSEDPPTGGED